MKRIGEKGKWMGRGWLEKRKGEKRRMRQDDKWEVLEWGCV